jgi:uncharacterized membrane protein HdeD (DUF308 family)
MRRLDLAADQATEVARLWWLILLVGLLSLIAGVILVTKPSDSLTTLAVIVGIFLLIDGLVELVRSFETGVENRALSAILGVLGIVVGVALIRHPFHGVKAIGLLIGIWLVAAGAIRLVSAIAIPGHRIFRLAIALFDLIVGIVIVSDPHIGYTALAIIAGVWLIISGIGTMALGIALRGARPEASTSG